MVNRIWVLRERASLVAQWSRICLPMQETWVQPLGLEDPLEKGMATHASILVGKTPWTEKSVGYSPWGGERVGNNLATKYQQQLREDNFTKRPIFS